MRALLEQLLEEEEEEEATSHSSQAQDGTKNTKEVDSVDAYVLDLAMRGMYDDFGEHLGDLNGALQHLRSILILKQEEAPDSLETAMCRSNIGVLLKGRGNYLSAMKYHREALTVVERVAPNSLLLSSILHRIGLIQKEKGEFQNAL